MSKLESRGPGRAPLPKARVNAFFHPLGRTGSVTVAANRAQRRRTTLYQSARTAMPSPGAGPARSISVSSGCRTMP
ncbi:hypothetical protein [Reyranella sp.]|uniref:hypothetical protein n=1 Tax=Reyranella sp. TaxID=1929291 RepID=UPI002731556C|nr:hypothetical protein [Reyranella sp.]MDP2373397.1 hypothetical protein [Reyranella sp.]